MKTHERALAKELYMRGLNQKEVANRVNVQERTIGAWVKKYGWRTERDARINSDSGRIDALKDIIAQLTQQHIGVLEQLKDEKDPATRIEKQKLGFSLSNEVANYNKALESLQDQKRVSLAVYIDVMEQIFNALQLHSPKLYLKLVDFQQDHLAEVAIKYQ